MADGYGRNYLIARGLAVMESDASKKILAKQQDEAAKLDAQKREEAKELVACLCACEPKPDNEGAEIYRNGKCVVFYREARREIFYRFAAH